MNQQETKLKQEILSDVRMFKAQLAKCLSDLVDLEADIEYHFDKYWEYFRQNESVGNPETPDPHTEYWRSA